MTIRTRISFKEYCKLLFGLTYKRPMMKVILAVAVIMVLWIISFYLHILPVPKPRIYQYITLSMIALVQPAVIYSTIRRNYYSSNHLKEPMEINVSQTQLSMKGESFYTEIAWDKVFKIEEVQHWYLIYQNNLSAILISKKDMSNDQCHKFNEIARAIPNVPKKLK